MDAPMLFREDVDDTLCGLGEVPSAIDPCLYYVWDEVDGELQMTGMFIWHVDDCCTAGEGKKYEEILTGLKKRYPFRKWENFSGRFFKKSTV